MSNIFLFLQVDALRFYQLQLFEDQDINQLSFLLLGFRAPDSQLLVHQSLRTHIILEM